MSDPIWEIPFLGIVRCTITETEWRWEQIRPDAKMPQFRAADPLSALCIPSLRLDQPLHPDELSLLDFIETQEITYPVSASPFRQHVWEAMTTIPWGEFTTYGAIAEQIGVCRAYQAVGSAVGANPFPIKIPCHRVLPANGHLGHFALGVAWKASLLLWERRVLALR